MPNYRTILLQGLSDAGWEQVEIIGTSQWWAAEFWKIRSVKQNWGFEIYLTFQVDPQAHLQVASPRRASAVWKVSALEKLPDSCSEMTQLLSMEVRERNIYDHLDNFLSAIDDLRKCSRDSAKDV